MRRDSHTFSSSGFSTEISGSETMKVDDGKRVNIPSEWRHIFSPGTEVNFIYTGKYGLILLSTTYNRFIEEGKLNTEDISSELYRWRIDATGRIRFSDGFISSHNIPLGSVVYLVGVKTSIKVFFNEAEFIEHSNKSQQLILQTTEIMDSLL